MVMMEMRRRPQARLGEILSVSTCEYRNRRGSSKSKERVRTDHAGETAVNRPGKDFNHAPIFAVARHLSLRLCAPVFIAGLFDRDRRQISDRATLLNTQTRQHIRRHSNAAPTGVVAERTLSPDVQPRTNDAAPI
jgi:hypothetical protein